MAKTRWQDDEDDFGEDFDFLKPVDELREVISRARRAGTAATDLLRAVELSDPSALVYWPAKMRWPHCMAHFDVLREKLEEFRLPNPTPGHVTHFAEVVSSSTNDALSALATQSDLVSSAISGQKLSAEHLGRFDRAVQWLAESVEEAGRIAQRIEDQSSGRNPVANQTNVGGQRKQNRLAWLARALVAVNEDPAQSDREIAEIAGVHPSQLARSPEYQAAAKIARSRMTGGPRRGYKNGTTGDIEAIDLPPSD
jgi:hypothetical protein